MEKLDKTFVSGYKLRATEMNQLVGKINELVEKKADATAMKNQTTCDTIESLSDLL